jgi:predicted protein tyrosine phosphatase
MPWIQNVSLADVRNGTHIRVGENSMLIQIVDPDMQFPTPLYHFKEVHQFLFLDVEDSGLSNDGTGTAVDMSWGMITDSQAQALVALLQHALKNKMDVVVHCVAGVCRSGAVCEVGVMMGFGDTDAFRSPNLLVKHKMMRELGWTYDSDEPHTINGVALDPDWTNNNEKLFTLASARRSHREQNGE